MTTATTAAETWLDATAVGRRLNLSRHSVRRLGRLGLIRTRSLPGVRARYYLPDVERLAADFDAPRTSNGGADDQ